MQAFKEFLRNNVKLIGTLIVILLGLAGVKLAPETANDIAQTVVNVVAPAQAPQTIVPATDSTNAKTIPASQP